VLKDSVRTPLAAACAFESGHLTLIIERRGGLGGGGCELQLFHRSYSIKRERERERERERDLLGTISITTKV